LILDAAWKANLTLPVTEAAFQVNSEAFSLGPDQDFSIVIQEMESRGRREL
jgi:hypothetical protein